MWAHPQQGTIKTLCNPPMGRGHLNDHIGL